MTGDVGREGKGREVRVGRGGQFIRWGRGRSDTGDIGGTFDR